MAAGDGTRSFESWSQIEGTSDSYVSMSGTTEQFSDDVDCDGYAGVLFEVGLDADTTPVDDVRINVYASRDGTYTNARPIFQRQLDHDDGDQYVQFRVDGYDHVRLGFEQLDGADSHAVRAYRSRWIWQTAQS